MGELAVRYRLSHREWRILASGGAGLEGEPAFHYLVGELSITGERFSSMSSFTRHPRMNLGFFLGRPGGRPSATYIRANSTSSALSAG